MKSNSKNVERSVASLLGFFGENVKREGLLETPGRIVRIYQELLDGYSQDELNIFKVLEGNGYRNLVTVGNIDFYSLFAKNPDFKKIIIPFTTTVQNISKWIFEQLDDKFKDVYKTCLKLKYIKLLETSTGYVIYQRNDN